MTTNHKTTLVKIDLTLIFIGRVPLALEQLGTEQITDPSDRADQPAAPAQLLAQMADVDVERSIQGRRRPLVDRRGQLVARDDPARRADDQIQNVELDRRQLERPARRTRPRGCPVIA